MTASPDIHEGLADWNRGNRAQRNVSATSDSPTSTLTSKSPAPFTLTSPRPALLFCYSLFNTLLFGSAMLPCPVTQRLQPRQNLPCLLPVSGSRLLISYLEHPTSALCRRHRDAKPVTASLVESAFTKRDAVSDHPIRMRVLPAPCKASGSERSTVCVPRMKLRGESIEDSELVGKDLSSLTLVFATDPKNRQLSLIIATLPKTRSRKPLVCHTSDTPRGCALPPRTSAYSAPPRYLFSPPLVTRTRVPLFTFKFPPLRTDFRASSPRANLEAVFSLHLSAN